MGQQGHDDPRWKGRVEIKFILDFKILYGMKERRGEKEAKRKTMRQSHTYLSEIITRKAKGQINSIYAGTRVRMEFSHM